MTVTAPARTAGPTSPRHRRRQTPRVTVHSDDKLASLLVHGAHALARQLKKLPEFQPHDLCPGRSILMRSSDGMIACTIAGSTPLIVASPGLYLEVVALKPVGFLIRPGLSLTNPDAPPEVQMCLSGFCPYGVDKRRRGIQSYRPFLLYPPVATAD